MIIHQELQNLLQKAGLTESEAQIYIELLKNPAQTKWELVARTGLDRNQIYRAFETLENFQMVTKTDRGIKAVSPKGLIAELLKTDRNSKKLAHKIRNIAPFLRLPTESIEEIESCHTQDQILETYDMMSQVKYSHCLDFGDLEGFVKVLGGLDPVFKFRINRFKQAAKNLAICTTVGPYTEYMSRKNDMEKYKANINQLNLNFKDKWIIFSDTNDYVMFNDFSDQNSPSAIVIKSKIVADTQRLQFQQFYQNLEKF